MCDISDTVETEYGKNAIRPTSSKANRDPEAFADSPTEVLKKQGESVRKRRKI